MGIDWNLIVRLVIAGLLGGLIGVERMFRAKEAGLRTHFIVALGSALFMIISQYAFEGQFDRARVAAQVVSGIGFLGAGVIIFQKNVVRGITTAAGLWVVAAIGLSCGAAMYSVAVATTLLVILVLETMHFITDRYGERLFSMTLSPVTNDALLAIMEKIKASGAEILRFTLSEGVATLDMRVTHNRYARTVNTILASTEGMRVEIS